MDEAWYTQKGAKHSLDIWQWIYSTNYWGMLLTLEDFKNGSIPLLSFPMTKNFTSFLIYFQHWKKVHLKGSLLTRWVPQTHTGQAVKHSQAC